MAKKKGQPPAAAPARPLTAPERGVKIRMYRQGLGDCFLLAFRGDDGGPRYVLIDCGVHMSQTGGRARMRAIVADICAATGGHLHVVVATHEHTDHLSGFVQEHAAFAGLTIDELWLGWTEDPDDSTAARLRQRRGHTRRAIEAALKKLEQAQPRGRKGKTADGAAAERSRGFTEFFGLADGVDLGAAARAAGVSKDKATSNEVAYALLRERAAGERCHRPGTLAAIPGVPDVRVYVLGPPEDEDLLGQADPAGGAASEVYFQGPALNETTSFASAALNALEPSSLNDEEKELLELSFPFDEGDRLSHKEAVKYRDATGRAFFQEHYGFSDKEAEPWRRIETDWLRPAAELALNLDAATNNTSLALAFELPGGAVLLFPGDAQVGSWLSWKELHWSVAGKRVTVDDLFARVVLYKVGHHASHNGTLKADGLEKMGDDLIALIPVDQQAASKLKGWHMPYAPLYQRLQGKTGGRILRADKDCPLLAEDATKPVGLSPAQWQEFRNTEQHKLDSDTGYFEFTVGG
jgi:hypothetical protein